MYYVFSFKSRSEAIKLYDKCKKETRVSLISTPQSISRGCSLSVKCENDGYNAVYSAFSAMRFTTFLGAYAIRNEGGITSVKRILY